VGIKNLIKEYIQDIECDKSKAAIKAKVIFPKHFKGFEGHFPQRPILPAVIQVIAARVILETYFKKSFELTSIKKCKFRNMVGPDEPINYTIYFEDRGSNSFNINMNITNVDDKPVAQCFFQLREYFS